MFPEIFALLALLAGGMVAADQIDAKVNGLASAVQSVNWAALPEFPSKAKFQPAARAVTNWRIEAAGGLDLTPEAVAKFAAGPDPPAVARCVKLNNYWCIKRAGWAGEIAADPDGHVAFASAIEGAIVAAILLRRYYLDYNRRSAQAILSRWAPAQCGNGTAIAFNARRRGRVKPGGADAFALHGIGNTLRARWLAAHRPGFGGGKIPALRRSIIADRPAPLMRAPQIAVGMGEVEIDRTPIKIAALEVASPAAGPAASAVGAACPNEIQRIHNYALRAIEGVASDPNEDLKLFSPDGAPGPNLPRLMRNMARVEIGPLGARADLIAAAVEIAARRLQTAGADGSAAR